MKLSEMLHRPSMWTRVSTRVRRAAATSALLRGVLWTGLAIGVTVGGVLAGALVVAPVAAKVSHPETMARTTQAVSSTAASAYAVAREVASATATKFRAMAESATAGRWSHAVTAVLSNTPESARTMALPLLVVVTLLAAITALVLRRRTPSTARLALAPVSASRGRARSTPKAAGRQMGRADHRTPKTVEALAATGVSATDIAKRIGLPIDAVRLLIAISSESRQVQPPAA